MIEAELRAIWLDNYVLDKYIDAYLDMEFDYEEDNILNTIDGYTLYAKDNCLLVTSEE